ncbi:MAG: TIGR04255 family protein, partial [Betaproteobacteria bacterium]|nr:TIGR04255 family protein [Betaproteobacteria bacterium]
MPLSRPPLPDFRNPPVGEVVLSLQFSPIPGFQATHLGLLWSRFRTKYPKSETYPPIDPVIEQFGTRPQPAQRIRLEVIQSGFMPRAWFLNEDGTELVQVQQDRFIRNWRKLKETDEYPRYEKLRERFEEDFKEFNQFIRAENLPEIVPNQCEVTYIN